MSQSEKKPTELRPVPDPGVTEWPRWRTFTAEYKLAIIREGDA